MRKNRAVLWISKEVQDKVKSLGKMGDTYDSVLRRVLGMEKGPPDNRIGPRKKTQ